MADVLDEGDFNNAGSGASQTYPQQCSALRKNGYVVIKHRPCKIVEMSTSKTGKHGHAKVHMVALDIFNGRKYEDICPSTHNMDVPHVKRKDYQFLNIDDDYLALMDESGAMKEDIKVPDNDIGKDIRQRQAAGDESFLVTILCAMGEEAAVSTKTMSEK